MNLLIIILTYLDLEVHAFPPWVFNLLIFKIGLTIPFEIWKIPTAWGVDIH